MKSHLGSAIWLRHTVVSAFPTIKVRANPMIACKGPVLLALLSMLYLGCSTSTSSDGSGVFMGTYDAVSANGQSFPLLLSSDDGCTTTGLHGEMAGSPPRTLIGESAEPSRTISMARSQAATHSMVQTCSCPLSPELANVRPIRIWCPQL